jgi:hypothetical protein
MRSEKSSELNTSEKFASLQEEVTNIAKARKIFTLQMMRRSIFSSLTEACTLQSHALHMLQIHILIYAVR